MKIYIGPYPRGISVYDITEKVLKIFIKDENTIDKICYRITKSSLGNFICKINSMLKVKRSIKIHRYDTWSMDDTLSHIIHPMLVQLRKTKQGSPSVSDEDVPEYLRDADCPHARWEWILDEMIWAFNEIRENTWEDQYYSGEIDFNLVENVFVQGPNHTHKINKEGLKKHAERIRNGTTLFGKYYQNLWD
jgi:hypothetical protein